MLNTIAVQVIQGQSDIVHDTHLDVIWEIPLPALKKVSEALLHQFHEENWPAIAARTRVLQNTQELYDARVPKLTQDPTLQLETTDEVDHVGIVRGEKGVVKELSSARKVIELGFNDAAIGAPTNDLRWLNQQLFVTERSPEVSFSRCGWAFFFHKALSY